MPNKNYRAGRAFEYQTMERWREEGYEAMRTSGSHGPFDVIAIRIDRKPEFIQCKRTSSETTAKRLLKTFKETTIPSSFYHQTMVVKVKGKSITLSGTV